MRNINPIEAYSRHIQGELVFFRYKNQGTWIKVDSIFTNSFDKIIERYEFALKPEPALRPWKPEEVPVGALLRDKRVVFGNIAITSIIAVRGAWIHYLDPSVARLTEQPCQYFDENWEHSLDLGKTWQPCGVLE